MTDAYERELARSVDAVGDECPECEGTGELYWPGVTSKCPRCNGTGYVEHDAMDDADSAYERAGDR
jgi:DnaJ-class molecular chaperone